MRRFSIVFWSFVLVSCVADDPLPSRDDLSGDEVATPDHPRRALTASFPVKFGIPDALVSAAYTGLTPVTFGVPFQKGEMLSTDGRRLRTIANVPLEADFDILAKWPDGSVKWLLVDALVQVSSGVAPEVKLDYGSAVSNFTPTQPISITTVNGIIHVHTNGTTYAFTPSDPAVGRFELVTKDFTTNVVKTYSTAAATTKVEIEKGGRVRSTIKLSGAYQASDGTVTGKFVTRVRLYARTPYTRVFHTMTWTDSAARGIASLAFIPRGLGASPQYLYAVDGVQNTQASLDLYQTGPHSIVTSGPVLGKRFDGWTEARWSSGASKLFVGLRWPWQQFPVRLQTSPTRLAMHAIGPHGVMSLAAKDLASPVGPPMNLERYEDPYTNLRAHASNDPVFHPPATCGAITCNAGDPCVDDACQVTPVTTHGESGAYAPALSPVGVAKSYELLVWPSTASVTATLHGVPPAQRNALLQTPVYAYPAPVHAVLAGLPSPMSAADPASFPEIEGAIEKAFDWVTRQREAEGDYGTFNFGDVQYDWTADYTNRGHVVAYRYWLNHGKGWSPVPWLLYLRSGARKYLETGEAYARHLMDVDTSHVTNPALRKFVGGQVGYGPIHFGSDTFPMSIENESEYLGLYYYITGYERARDVIEERRKALQTPTGVTDVTTVQDMLAYLSPPSASNPTGTVDWPVRFNREHYLAIGELAAVYELTGDAALANLANGLVTRLVASQAANGWLPGIKTNHWFSNSLTLAHRVFPANAAQLFGVLRKYEDHLGNVLVPSTSAPQVEGPSSLWTLALLAQGTGDARYLEVAAKTTLAQALSVHTSANEWRGLTPIPVQYLGPQIRGWLATLEQLAKMPANQRPVGAAPIAYFTSGLVPKPASQGGTWDGRHVLYALESTDKTFTVALDFEAANLGYHHDLAIRVWRPDGTLATQTSGVYDAPPTEYAGFSAFCPSCTPPYTTAQLAAYQKGRTITIAADGQTGAYAIEILNEDRTTARPDLPVWARSSEGKLVHYVPSFVERATLISPYDLYQVLAKDGGSAVAGGGGPANTYAGQLWFQPTLAGDVTIGLFSGGLPLPATPQPAGFAFTPTYYKEWPRVVAYRPGLVEACHTEVTGTDLTDTLGNPSGAPCTFTPTSTALHSAVVANTNWHMSLHLGGARPFLASSATEWFDPTLVAHKPATDFLDLTLAP